MLIYKAFMVAVRLMKDNRQTATWAQTWAQKEIDMRNLVFTVLVAVLVAGALCGCNAAPQQDVPGEVCRPNDPAWTACMSVRKPGRHAPTKLVFKDWRT